MHWHPMRYYNLDKELQWSTNFFHLLVIDFQVGICACIALEA